MEIVPPVKTIDTRGFIELLMPGEDATTIVQSQAAILEVWRAVVPVVP
jgi:hypothetical protein